MNDFFNSLHKVLIKKQLEELDKQHEEDIARLKKEKEKYSLPSEKAGYDVMINQTTLSYTIHKRMFKAFLSDNEFERESKFKELSSILSQFTRILNDLEKEDFVK